MCPYMQLFSCLRNYLLACFLFFVFVSCLPFLLFAGCQFEHLPLGLDAQSADSFVEGPAPSSPAMTKFLQLDSDSCAP